MDFLKIDNDQDEDELFFEGPDLPPETELAVPAPPPKAPRKRVAKGAAVAEVTPDVAPAPPAAVDQAEPPQAPVAAMDNADHSAPSHHPIDATAPAVLAPTRAAPAAPARLQKTLLLVAVVGALFASVGLLVALRTLTTMEAKREELAKREAALARLPAVLEEVEALAARQRAELDRAAAQQPANLVTVDELNRQLSALRFGLSKTQAPGTSALAGVMRQGQAELADRIADLASRVEAVERARAPAMARH